MNETDFLTFTADKNLLVISGSGRIGKEFVFQLSKTGKQIVRKYDQTFKRTYSTSQLQQRAKMKCAVISYQNLPDEIKKITSFHRFVSNYLKNFY